MRRAISSREWLWWGVATTFVLLLFTIPYLVGAAASTPENQFGGFVFGLDDMHSYIAKMRYGALNGWLLQLVYTTEAHEGGIVYSHYLALGKATAFITDEGSTVGAQSLIVAYHLMRIICAGLLLASLYRFIAAFIQPVAQRRLAWGIAALSGGLGWIRYLGIAIPHHLKTPDLPLELYVPEAFTLLLVYGLPHLALARCLMLEGWLALLSESAKPAWQKSLLAGLAWFGMGLIVPFYVALIAVLIGAWLVGVWVWAKRFPVDEAKRSGIALLFPLGLLAYNLWLFSTNPAFAAWAAQNLLWSPPLIEYLLAYSIPVGLSLVAIRSFRKRDFDSKTALLLVWPVVAFGLAYAPVSVQRRLVEGVIVPLSILAAQGIFSVKFATPRPAIRWVVGVLIPALLLLLLIPSVVILIAGGSAIAAGQSAPIFHSQDERSAMDWLRREAPIGSVILSTLESGNILPAYAGVRVYVGHGSETMNALAKAEEARQFFSGEMNDQMQRDLLTKSGADYLWIGTPELEAAQCGDDVCIDPATLGLKIVFHQGDYAIYEVTR